MVDYMKFSTFVLLACLSSLPTVLNFVFPIGFSGQGVVCYATFFCPPCRHAVFPDGVDFV
ncbi:hypothetical protein DQ245_18330 [Escherichia coli]|nr:hypothetical protein [Escherichia coli]EFX7209852.1 hypothetical protein [Shigella sonnei]EAA1970211.1 hypothetical protein [Escherichia coli]EAB0837711.1 hypothetical protein [Escherichia coli]EAC0243970.1 hypothetical protein [Escherichia coli]